MGKTIRRNSENTFSSTKEVRKFRKMKRFEKSDKGRDEIIEYINGARKFMSATVDENRR